MTWGVRYLQDAQSFDYTEAVIRSAMVPMGWIIGCHYSALFPTASAGASP
jgi:hypothetical protein